MSHTIADIHQEAPVFILGAKRGGTTLLKRIIESHSSITIPPPDWFYHFIYPHLYSYGDLTQRSNLTALISDCLQLPTIRSHWRLTVEVDYVLDRLLEASYRGVIATLFRCYAETNPTLLWGSKTPGNVFWLPEIYEDFPEAKFIFIYRDGRDVSIDQVDTEWGPMNLYEACVWWRSYTQAMLESKRFLPPQSFHEIRYEELVRQPESVVRGICGFLGWDFEPQMLRYYESGKDPFFSQSHHQKTSQPITDAYVGMYKRLSAADRALQLEVAGQTLEELGYAISESSRAIGFWERERYFEESRHGATESGGVGPSVKYNLRRSRMQRLAEGIWSEASRQAFIVARDQKEEYVP